MVACPGNLGPMGGLGHKKEGGPLTVLFFSGQAYLHGGSHFCTAAAAPDNLKRDGQCHKGNAGDICSDIGMDEAETAPKEHEPLPPGGMGEEPSLNRRPNSNHADQGPNNNPDGLEPVDINEEQGRRIDEEIGDQESCNGELRGVQSCLERVPLCNASARESSQGYRRCYVRNDSEVEDEHMGRQH